MLITPEIHYPQTCPNVEGFHSTDLAKCFLMVSLSSQTDHISPHFDHSKVSLSPNMLPFKGFHSIDPAKCCIMVSVSSQTDQISPHLDHSKVSLSPNMPPFKGFHSIDLAKCFSMVSFSSQTDQISAHFDHSKVSPSPKMPQLSKVPFDRSREMLFNNVILVSNRQNLASF